MAYEKLFEPGRIGTMTIKNRGVMAPMGSNLAGNDGNATDRQIKYYQERAKGGIGMIVNEYTGVDDVDSMPSVNYYRVARDHNLASSHSFTTQVPHPILRTQDGTISHRARCRLRTASRCLVR